MDRNMIYPGAIPLETDLLGAQKFALIGLAKMAAAVLGTATVVNGLSVVPTGPASLNVSVNPGEIYSTQNADTTAFSSLPLDNHQITKQGVSLDVKTLGCAAPATVGQSVNYLIQAIYADTDDTPIVLPYYNASNPATAYAGPNNTGIAQNTVRRGLITVSAKAGAAATTGSQTTPAPDTGFIGLYVVTVANGQTTINAGSIALFAGAPILPGSVLAAIQTGALSTAVAGGTSSAITASFPLASAAWSSGQPLTIISAATNPGTMTAIITLGSTAQASVSVVKGNNQPVVAGDFPIGYPGEFAYSPSFGALVLNNPATGVSSGGGRLINTIYYSVVAQTVALSIASPGVVTYASADKLPKENAPIVPATTGALPTGLVAGTTYYVKGASGSTSNLSATPGGAAIAFTGSQSGTQSVANPAYLKATNSPSFVIVDIYGGGGGSGGLTAVANASGGGGSGGVSRKKILSAALLTSETVTIGVGGAAGNTAGTSGGVGGTTSFGSHFSATGGVGSFGVPTATSGSNPGALGGVGVGGDLDLSGAAGCSGTGAGGSPYAISGAGGTSPLGGNGPGVGGTVSAPGTNAVPGSGSGAGGAIGASPQPGGIGAYGFATIYEYA